MLAISTWQEIKDTAQLAQFAIEASLASDWKEAQQINEKIIDLDSNDVEAHNRLAHAYICQGQKEKAKAIYNKVLQIDAYNIIARKNLEKISKMNGQTTIGNNKVNMTQVFVSEPGRTKVINLLNLAPPAVISTLNCGDTVHLNQKKHGVFISSDDGTYLGALPDDLAHRLISFLSGGNKYEAYVKYATVKTLAIFIRETERSARFVNQPSFADGAKFFFEEKDIVS